MKINVRFFTLVAISLITTALSVLVVAWASEAFFFDRFYYYKSVKHGYWVPRSPDKPLSPNDFGKRGHDIAMLSDFIRKQSSSTLGSATGDKIFTIAVIGDSYVWGQGIEEKYRFVNILEKKLNNIRPTRVLSFGMSGDSLLDNYIKYYYAINANHIDLTIFGVVDNDLLLRKQNLYDTAAQTNLSMACNKPVITDPPEFSVSREKYEQALKQSYDKENFGNWCMFTKALKNIPTTNTQFFNFGDNFGFPELLKIYTNELKARGFSVVSFDLGETGINKLHVSQKEPHPSALANKLFADTIYDEVIKLSYFYQ